MFYIVLFVTTTILFYLAQKCHGRWPLGFWLLSYLAVFLLAGVAGLRDETVGTDVLFYAKSDFYSAYFADSFWSGFQKQPHEIGCYTLNYLASGISSKLQMGLFLSNLVQSLFVFFGMRYFAPRVPLWLTMLVYQVCFYCLTLNLMRQGLAMSVVLWSFKFLEQRRIYALLLSAVLAFCFHKSAVVPYAVFFAVYWLQGKNYESQKKWLFVAFAVTVLGVIAFGIVMSYIVEHVPLFALYAAYSDDDVFKSGVSTVDVLVRLLMLVVCLWCLKTKTYGFNSLIPLTVLVLADCGAQFLGCYTYFASRVGYYFLICSIPCFLSLIINVRNVSRPTRWVVCWAFVLFWVYHYVRFVEIAGFNETNPYSSEILGL